MERSFFFNARVVDGIPDVTYSAEDLAVERGAYFSDGVLSQNGLTFEDSVGNIVIMSPGAAVIDGHTYVNTEALPTPLASADPSYDRIDLAVIRLDTAARRMYLAVVKGSPTPHPEPSAPLWTDTVKELPLARILVRAGGSSLEEGDITDVRTFSVYAPDENGKRAIVEEYLASLNTFTDEEAESIRRVIGTVATDKDKNSVLCGDGNYRVPGTLKKVELVRYTDAGKHTFSTYNYPSEGLLYDVVLVGGGGGGGCAAKEYSRGGGGGAGAYLQVNAVTLPSGALPVVVGKGGDGVKEDSGSDGGESSFGGYFVPGGKGGEGGSDDGSLSVSGGKGGEGAFFRGNKGGDGCISVLNESIKTYGVGAGSFFGAGGRNLSAEINAPGADGENYGSGGSGAGCEAGRGLSGGKGCDGAVIVYGYVRGDFVE